MEEIIGWLIGAAVVIAIVFFVVWIILAVLFRVFAWIVFYWCVMFTLCAIAGLIAGFVVPFRVLMGKSVIKPEIATPDEVVAQNVIKHRTRGANRFFGWDRAWPEYNPYQAERDRAAVRLETHRIVSELWVRLSKGVRKPSISAAGSGVKKVGSISMSLMKSAPGILWGIFVPIPYFGFFIGTWLSFAIWFAIMWVIGGAVWLGQWLFVLVYYWLDRGKLRGASVKCPYCYQENPRPSYECPNPSCTIVHHDVTPGPLGVINRTCACGVSFPTTIGEASKVLVAQCPTCGAQLAPGTGARRAIQFPVFGSVGAGKTRFLYATMVASAFQLTDLGGEVQGLDKGTDDFLKAAAKAITTGEGSDKTIPTLRPRGFPVRMADKEGHTLELQLMDASGESFVSLQSTEELTYVNSAMAMAFVFDPLAVPRVQQELRGRSDLSSVLVAVGEQEDAYASVVDRIRSEAVDVSKRHLAVVVTKADVLLQLNAGSNLAQDSSDGVRNWLISQEQDGFVRRIESDFGDVRYFAVDSLNNWTDVRNPLNPLHVLQWVFDTQKVPIVMIPPAVPEAAAVAPQSQLVGAR